jgi:protease I
MATLLMPLPESDFDPTESGVPWRTMRDHGHCVVFATPSGRTARADPVGSAMTVIFESFRRGRSP